MSGAIPPSDEHDDDELLQQIVDGKPADGPRTPEREAYEDLVDRIRDLPDIPPPAGWQERLETKRADRERAASRQRLWRRVVPATFAVMAAASVLIVFKVKGSKAPSARVTAENDVDVEPAPGTANRMRSEGNAVLGDTLTITVSRPEPVVEVRVYRGEEEVFRCPGPTGCWTDPRPLINAKARFKPAEMGEYRVIIIAGPTSIPPGSRNIDVDLGTLSRPFVVDYSHPTIEVH